MAFLSTSERALAVACAAVALPALLSLASCGGSSSETPPPLEPLPANVHYNRSATTLPGELGTPVKEPVAAPVASEEPPSTIGEPAVPTAPAAPAAPAPAASASGKH